MIDTRTPPRLVPPLRRPEATPPRRVPPPQLNIVRAQPAPAPSPREKGQLISPVASASSLPPPPPNGVTTGRAHPEREFFCRACDKRATGSVPFGWLRLLRSVHPDSLPAARLLIRRDHKGRAKYADQALGLFCSAECLAIAMPRLVDLVREFTEQGVGLQAPRLGEPPPDLPAPDEGRSSMKWESGRYIG
jgi:hypothetical protein